MKKNLTIKSLLIFSTIFLTLNCVCQDVSHIEDSGNITHTLDKFKILNEKINSAHEELFRNLKKEKIKTGFLVDQLVTSKIINQKETDIYETTIFASDWKKTYNQLFFAQFQSKIIPSFDVLENTIEFTKSNNQTPIGLINLDYNKIKDDAVKNGLIKVDKNKLFDNSDKKQTPYTIENITLAVPLVNALNSLNTTFCLSDDLYFSNNNDILTIKVDFGDNNGFRIIKSNSAIDITYSSSGLKDITIEITKRKKTYLFHSQISVISETSVNHKSTTIQNGTEYRNPDFVKYLSDGSRAYIEFNNGIQLKKPFLFVEGLNFQPSSDCSENSLRFGTFGWDVFRSGIDLPCSSDPLNISYLPDLIANLKSEGFDIILLDFKDGAGSIVSNADILIELINWVNNNLFENNKLVIAGASMGGIVSRFALSKMEQTQQEHNTRLYISLDAPHNGANIPLGDQSLLYYFSLFDEITNENPDIIDGLNKLSKMAPKELLNYHYLGSYLHQNLISNPYYQFPQKPYSVAISNGAANGTNQGFNAGEKMVDIDEEIHMNIAGINILIARIQGETFAVSNNSKYFWGKVYIAPTNNEVTLNCTNCKPYDSAPGSTRNTNSDIGKGDEIFANHCFIPTISALALNTEDLFYNIASSRLMNNYPFVRNENKDLCPFDLFYINPSFTNQKHVETTFNNISWIADKTSPNDVLLQNQNLDGKYEIRNNIIAGNDIFSSENSPDKGNVNVATGKNVEIIAGNSIKFKPGVHIQSGSYLNAHIGSFNDEYNIPSTKSIKASKKINDFNLGEIMFDIISDENLTNKNKSDIYIYPNPAKDYLNIEIENGESDNVNILLFNTLGKLVHKDNFYGRKHKINIRDLSEGIYTIQIKSISKSFSKQVILRH